MSPVANLDIFQCYPSIKVQGMCGKPTAVSVRMVKSDDNRGRQGGGQCDGKDVMNMFIEEIWKTVAGISRVGHS